VALSSGGPIGPEQLSETAPPASASPGSFREQVEALERSLLTRALAAAGGNQSEAARKLALSRATFLDKLKRYGLA
jgi:two-component system response regulator AtoC